VEPILAKLTYRDDQTIFSEDEVMLLGQRLYQLLFQGTTASLFQSATSAARKDKQPLQLELQLASHPDLVPVATLPWEFLTDPQGHPLLTLHSLVRSLPHTSPIPPLMVDGPLTMLLAWALPAELAAAYPLNIAAEVHAIQTQLQPLIAANQLMLHILPHATPLSLNRALEDHQPHLLHLLGHGQAATSRAPQLVLETEEGTMQPMSPKQLAIALQGSQVRLVVLNTCHSGAQGTQLFQAFGPALLASGVPAIVGMQASVLDRAGRIFAAELYRTLGKTGSIDQAVQQGRKALIMTDISQVDWGLVTLYLRARDGRLFGMPEVTESPPKPSPPSGGSGTVFNQTGQQVGTQYNAAGTQTIHTTHQSGGINFGNARIGSIGSVTTNDQPAAPQHVYHVYEGGNIVSGDTFEMSGNFSGAILNIKNTLTNTIQTVNGMAQAAPDQKQELARLLQQLQAALMTVPAEHQETAEAVADTAKELIEKAAKDKPNKTTIQITAEGLKAAAGNLAVVVPMIIPLATQIVQGVQKLIGG
ncbi:MAG TPA: CHAT domain-containing protein, partial [Herpetosiphonaceae bacterium]